MIQSSSTLLVVITAVVLSVVATALVSSTSSSSPATEQNGWSVSGSGFHRTATFRLTKEKVGATSSLSSLTSNNNDNNENIISIILAVPKDFYIDVNELWKRSKLKISSSSFEFIGSDSDAFIDIEGPSFRSKTVPQITKVELKFRFSQSKQQQSKQDSSFFELTLPVHARYNSPVGELVSSTTSGLSISSLSSQLTDLLQFRENYVDLSFNLKFESLKKIIVIENDKVKQEVVVKTTDLSSIFNNNKPFNWRMPVGNNEHAQVVFWITTSLVILGAVSVIVAAMLPVGSGGEKRTARSLSR